jgi:hypothetical protein
MLYDQVNFCTFRDGFEKAGRKDQFSYEALSALFDYLEALSDDIGENIEFDPIGICCEWCEAAPEEINNYFSIKDIPEDEEEEQEEQDEEELKEMVEDYLGKNTIYLTLGNGNILYQNF